tara:strand:- start:2202 stop:2363 length:162 start_codon:yes stop_codon:yes gene_type:complete
MALFLSFIAAWILMCGFGLVLARSSKLADDAALAQMVEKGQHLTLIVDNRKTA